MCFECVLVIAHQDWVKTMTAKTGRLLKRSDFETITSEISTRSDQLDQLKIMMRNATIVDDADFPSDIAAIDSTIVFLEPDGGTLHELTLSSAGNCLLSQGSFSVFSEFGPVLFGIRLGQTITWKDLDGNTMRLEVRSIKD